LERLQITGVPDLYQIASTLGLKVKEEDLEGCDGVLVRAKGVPRGIIAVKRSVRSEARKRFTVAHEIGHYVLPGHDDGGSICRPADIEGWTHKSNIKEREADDFAAELLIPTAVVRVHLARRTPSLSVIETVANECAASLSASAWKYCDLTSEQCAIVWSEAGKVSWSRRSPEFPFFIANGRPLSLATYAYNCLMGETVPTKPEPVSADAWIESYNLRLDAVIHEESRSLPSYDSVLTLLWIKDQIQIKSEYQEEDDESMDPKDFTVYRKKWPK
jgi:uncharacterized protein DUF955